MPKAYKGEVIYMSRLASKIQVSAQEALRQQNIINELSQNIKGTL